MTPNTQTSVNEGRMGFDAFIPGCSSDPILLVEIDRYIGLPIFIPIFKHCQPWTIPARAEIRTHNLGLQVHFSI